MTSPVSMTANITLTAKCAGGAQQRYQLGASQGVFVGSSNNCGLKLRGEGVADIHCRLQFDDGVLTVQDWMTSEGTRVNGQMIEGLVELGSEDVIQIGACELWMDTGSQSERPELDSSSSDPDDRSDEAGFDSDETGRGDLPEAMQLHEQSSHGETAEETSLEASMFEGNAPETVMMDTDAFFFDDEDDDDEELYDRETVELLRAEIEELRCELAQRDADTPAPEPAPVAVDNADEQADQMMDRMQQLIEEANRSDERVALLEEMLHAAEDSNRCEVEERQQLEAWVADIELRIGQRESEHAAEIESLKQRLEEAGEQQDRLRRKLQKAAASGNASQQFEETLETLQRENRDLQQRLEDAEKQRLSVQTRLDEASGMHDRAIREERAKLAQEQARVSRMRFELSRKLSELEETPEETNNVDRETAHRIRTLREHLREIHEQEKLEEKDTSLSTRLSRLWKRVDQ